MAELLEVLQDRVLLCDGAMGSRIQVMDLDLEKDFLGKENCTEILNLSRPDVIRFVHEEYLSAGADMILTNSFGGSPVTLGEFGLSEKAFELNKRAAEIAREAADRHKDRERFVLGSVGPGTKLLTLGHLDYDTAEAAFREQAAGLIAGGVDAVLIETCQDLLQVKAAVNGAKLARSQCRRYIPIFVTVTMESVGTMLVGSDISAAATVLESLGVDLMGMNCATGPAEMAENVRWLSQNWPRLIGIQPNAGLPELLNGKTNYPLGPCDLGQWLERFVVENGVNFIGGCCGTGVAHIQELDQMLRRLADGAQRPRSVKRQPQWTPSIASLYSSVALAQENAYLAIGERCNANGSKQWRDLQAKNDWEGCVEMAKAQVREGSHALDVCTAFVGRNEVSDMAEVVRRMVASVQAPLVFDSTELNVLETALKLYGGKAIINSINFEDGDEPARKRLFLAKKFGCAVIALTIDESGMAKTPERKLEIGERLYRLAVNECGLEPEDLLIDPLTFTIATGNDDDRKLAMATLEAVELIHKAMPRAQLILGLSNVSFGLKPHMRHVLNSVMLKHALERGLTGAILHHSKIMPLHMIEPELLKAAEDLIFDRRAPGFDPLQAFIALFSDQEDERAVHEEVPQSVEARLERRIVEGDRSGLSADLDEALKSYAPLEIINNILLRGMRTVGELFGSGKMQLPFVLRSAETMKAAVAHLEPLMERVEGQHRGMIVLATVKGDVHDIGKNLVDIILSNNGYRVINLGIKQPIDAIIGAALEHKADAIGLSGLLVKSTVVMRENLEELSRRGIETPVLLGGAALTRRYVETECAEAYACGRVTYAGNAFDALTLMDRIVEGTFDDYVRAQRVWSRAKIEARAAATEQSCVDRPAATAKRRSMAVDVPTPAFWGSRILEVSPQALLPFLNERSLFMQHWGYRKHGRSLEAYMEEARRELRPVVQQIMELSAAENALQPRAVYGFWPAAAEGNDLILYSTDDPRREIVRWTMPRGKGDASGLGPCITDFVRDVGGGERDVVGLQLVTMGKGASEVSRRWFEQSRYRDYVYLHGLGVELTEAFAEYVHKRVRVELGIGGSDATDFAQLLQQGYRGSRYSFGYPACPRVEDQKQILELLGAERIGVSLTDEFMLSPEQSTSAVVIHHPSARYFMPA
jgi:5-methyltetrahydrofolate--homocysteine methyltransferase